MQGQRKRWLGVLVATAMIAAFAFAGPVVAAEAEGASTAVVAVELPEGAELADRLEDRPDALVEGDTVEAFRVRAAASLSKTAAEHFGPFDASKAAALGQTDYFEADDVQLFVVDEGVMAVPLHYVVATDGTMVPPEPEVDNGMSNPIFSGPWGSESVYFSTFYNSDDGGYFCGTNHGENRGKWIWRKLSDSSSSYDYYGVDATSVAEVTTFTSCDEWVDSFGVGVKSARSGAIYLDQSPLSDYNSNCSNTTFSVGGSFGGVSASVSQTVQRCDYWDVIGGNAGPGSTWYKIQYYDNGSRPLSREAANLSVYRVPQGTSPALWTWLQLNIEND